MNKQVRSAAQGAAEEDGYIRDLTARTDASIEQEELRARGVVSAAVAEMTGAASVRLPQAPPFLVETYDPEFAKVRAHADRENDEFDELAAAVAMELDMLIERATVEMNHHLRGRRRADAMLGGLRAMRDANLDPLSDLNGDHANSIWAAAALFDRIAGRSEPGEPSSTSSGALRARAAATSDRTLSPTVELDASR